MYGGRGRASPCRRMARTLHLAEHAGFARGAGRRRGGAAPATARWCASRRAGPRSSKTCRPGGSTRTATIVIERGRPSRAGAAQARLRRASSSVAIAIDEARRDRRRSGRSTPWACRRTTRHGELITDSSPTPSARCSTGCRRRAAAIPRRSRTRLRGRSARGRTRSGARSRPAMCWSSRSNEGAHSHDRPPQPRRHRGAGPRGRKPRSIAIRSAPTCPSRSRSPSMASRWSSSSCRTPRSSSSSRSARTRRSRVPRAQSRRRHPPHLLRGRRHPRRPRPPGARRGARARPGEPRIGAHGKPVLFLHPKDFCGTLVELEQA